MSDFNVVLAERSGLGQIRLCGCKSVHVSLGPVTLCLAPEAFAQAAMMIRDAMAQLAEITAREPEEAVPEMHGSQSHWTH
jgi:hypothetical protein